MKTSDHSSQLRAFLLIFAALFLSGCLPEEKIFASGLAKEWLKEQSVSREQLIMEPMYYFSHLDHDLDRATWLFIPQGQILHKRLMRNEFSRICKLLEGYIGTLDKLLNSKQLPERQLATVYLGLFSDLDAYLEGNKSMHEVHASIRQLEPYIRNLEIVLEEAVSRRLNTLVQTIGEHNSGI